MIQAKKKIQVNLYKLRKRYKYNTSKISKSQKSQKSHANFCTYDIVNIVNIVNIASANVCGQRGEWYLNYGVQSRECQVTVS